MSDQEKQGSSDEQATKPSQGKRADRVGREGKGRRRHNATTRSLDESVNMNELREIVELISEHGFTDFELENKDVRVRLRRELAPQIVSMPASQSHSSDAHVSGESSSITDASSSGATVTELASAPSAVGQTAAASSEDEGLHMITSPIVGTFFRAPSPNAEPFVGLGSQVNADTIVCIIEAMKLMNEIQAESAGVIAKIYVENGQPVEYGQPLFGIKQ